MTPRARAWFFAALATLLGPFVLSDGSATTATEVRTAVAPAPEEQEASTDSDAWPTVLPAPASDRFPEASPAGSVSAPAGSPAVRPVTAASGADYSALRGSEPFRTLHPARGPPSIS